jgi:5-hydroxyisourate hydrolase-like protein (transthyretin family)
MPAQVPGLKNVGAFAGGWWHSMALTWSKIPTRLALSNVSTGIGQSAALKASLFRSDAGSALAGQTIQFSVDGFPVASGTTNSAGLASASYLVPEALSLGNHSLTCALIEDATYYGSSAAATLKVAKGKVALSVPTVTGIALSSEALTATLKNQAGTPLAGRTLTFRVTIGTSTVTVGTALTESSGTASAPYTIPQGTPAGTYSIGVSFNGDALYLAGTGKGSLKVVKDTVAISVPAASGTAGAATVLTATLRSQTGTALPGQSLTFKVTIGTSTATVGTALTDNAGAAHVNYTIPSGTKVGTYSIGVSFAGDALHLAGSGKGSLSVK